MWLFNEFPRQLVQQKYGFQVTDAFLDHLRLSSARFNNGGSGSFLSSQGLLFTNHHVGADCIQKLSSAEHDYFNQGFYAPTQAEERACPDLEVNVLLKIDDVTAQLKKAAPAGTPAAQANKLERAEIARMEKACGESSGNRCDVVKLYAGGEYHLYQYKKYTDIRLVFSPEYAIASFGGDPDNFTYPRYDLDFALFRAYENGQPARIQEYLTWSREGAKDGELTFVSGHPGSTGRLAPMSELEFSRDVQYPVTLRRLQSLAKALLDFGAQSAETKRVSVENLAGVQNSLKAYTGFYGGLKDLQLMKLKQAEEDKLRAAVKADPEKAKKFGEVWNEAATAYERWRNFYKPYYLLEARPTSGSDLMRIARDVYRVAQERRKPNTERLPKYTDAALPSLEQELYSSAPISDSMEIVVIADYLATLSRELPDEPVVKKLLNGKTPLAAAKEYVGTSRLKEIDVRKVLASDAGAAEKSKDGMIRFMRILEPRAAELRKMKEERVDAILNGSAGKIAQARFAVFGSAAYPDATFTLRLTYGPVIGYKNAAGQAVPYATNFEGLYRHATGVEPFKLPERWVNAKSALNLSTAFDFVTTTDTHGGNSGSPTVNTRGEVIGILFDGNLEGLPNRFVFTDEQARSVHVASQAIVEALRNVYHADRILNELGM